MQAGGFRREPHRLPHLLRGAEKRTELSLRFRAQPWCLGRERGAGREMDSGTGRSLTSTTWARHHQVSWHPGSHSEDKGTTQVVDAEPRQAGWACSCICRPYRIAGQFSVFFRRNDPVNKLSPLALGPWPLLE